ncbi:MAG: hypothetical protein AAFY64_11375, partial [Pseudomonadota bacterium]
MRRNRLNMRDQLNSALRRAIIRGGVCAVVIATACGMSGAAFAQKQSNNVAELQKRVEQLEGQLVDLQVVIGTLESLAQSPGRGRISANPGRPSNIDPSRLSALET